MAESGGRLSIVAVLAAVASLASAGTSYYFSRQELAQQTLESDRGYQVQVYQHVRETLQQTQPTPAQVNAACALVLTLPDDSKLKFRLAQILVEEALNLQAQTGASYCSSLDELRETLADETAGGADKSTEVLSDAMPAQPVPEAAQEAPAPAQAPIQSPAPPPRAPSASDQAVVTPRSRDVIGGLELPGRVVQAPAPTEQMRQAQIQARIVNPVGWDVDVFYCLSGDEAGNRARAERAAKALAAAADARSDIAAGMKLGRVRLRELRQDVNARAGYRISGDVVRAEAGERAEAEALIAHLTNSDAGAPRLDILSSRSPWYISAFFCPATKGG